MRGETYLPYGAKIVKIGPADPEIDTFAPSEQVRYQTKLVAMATSLKEF